MSGKRKKNGTASHREASGLEGVYLPISPSHGEKVSLLRREMRKAGFTSR